MTRFKKGAAGGTFLNTGLQNEASGTAEVLKLSTHRSTTASIQLARKEQDGLGQSLDLGVHLDISLYIMRTGWTTHSTRSETSASGL